MDEERSHYSKIVASVSPLLMVVNGESNDLLEHAPSAGILRNTKKPKGVIMAVLGMSSHWGFDGTRSIFEKRAADRRPEGEERGICQGQSRWR